MTDEERERGRVLLWAFFCAALCVMLVAWRVRGAPVPPPKAAPSPVGDWVLTNGADNVFLLKVLPCGRYEEVMVYDAWLKRAPREPSRYAGTWRVEGRRLIMSGRRVLPDGSLERGATYPIECPLRADDMHDRSAMYRLKRARGR